MLNKLYNRLVEKGYAKTVFFSKEFEKDFKKFNKYLKTSKHIVDSSSEADSKQKSDRNRSNSCQRDKFEDQLEAECFGDTPEANPWTREVKNRFKGGVIE